jgi:transposase
MRWLARAGAAWRMLPNDLPPWEAVYQQTQRWLKAGCFEALVTPANEQERAQVQSLAQAVQRETGGTMRVAFVDQGYTGEAPAQAAQAEGIALHVIKLPEAKKGFVLLPRRWVVERSFGWLNRFRRLVRDYDRLPETLARLHFVIFAMLMLTHIQPLLKSPIVHNTL